MASEADPATGDPQPRQEDAPAFTLEQQAWIEQLITARIQSPTQPPASAAGTAAQRQGTDTSVDEQGYCP